MAYRYHSILRPISIGTFPGGHGVLLIHNYPCRIYIDEIDRNSYGFIDFETKLSDKEVQSYELVFVGEVDSYNEK